MHLIDRSSRTRRGLGLAVAAAMATGLATADLASADIIILRDGLNGYDGTQDATVFTYSTETPINDRNYGASDQLFSRNSTNRYRTLMSFDLSGLAGQTVLSATLTLSKETDVSEVLDAAKTVDLFQISTANAGWIQGTGDGTGEAATGEATGNSKAHNVSAWDGGSRIGFGTSLASLTPVASLTDAWSANDDLGTQYEFVLPVSLVQSWIDSPLDNAGLFLSNQGNSTLVVFASSEHANEAWRPTLAVEVVPEPASLALLGGVGGLLVLRRRS